MKLRRCRRRRSLSRRRRSRGRSGWHCATKKGEKRGKWRGRERGRARDQGGTTEVLPSLSANRN